MNEVSLFSLLIAIFWTGFFGWRLWTMHQRERTGYATKAEIIDIVGGWQRDGLRLEYSSYPVVRMYDQHGITIEQQLDEQNVYFLWRKGVKIDVIYHNGTIYVAPMWFKIVDVILTLSGVAMVIAQLFGDSFFSFS